MNKFILFIFLLSGCSSFNNDIKHCDFYEFAVIHEHKQIGTIPVHVCYYDKGE